MNVWPIMNIKLTNDAEIEDLYFNIYLNYISFTRFSNLTSYSLIMIVTDWKQWGSLI